MKYALKQVLMISEHFTRPSEVIWAVLLQNIENKYNTYNCHSF
jgi:hypothetical protein